MLHSTPPYAVLCCSDAVFIYRIHTVQWHDRKCKISWVTSSSSVWSIVMASCMNERILGWMSFKPSRIYVCTNGGKWSAYEISVSPLNLNEGVILHRPHIHNSHTHTHIPFQFIFHDAIQNNNPQPEGWVFAEVSLMYVICYAGVILLHYIPASEMLMAGIWGATKNNVKHLKYGKKIMIINSYNKDA